MAFQGKNTFTPLVGRVIPELRSVGLPLCWSVAWRSRCSSLASALREALGNKRGTTLRRTVSPTDRTSETSNQFPTGSSVVVRRGYCGRSPRDMFQNIGFMIASDASDCPPTSAIEPDLSSIIFHASIRLTLSWNGGITHVGLPLHQRPASAVH